MANLKTVQLSRNVDLAIFDENTFDIQLKKHKDVGITLTFEEIKLAYYKALIYRRLNG